MIRRHHCVGSIREDCLCDKSGQVHLRILFLNNIGR